MSVDPVDRLVNLKAEYEAEQAAVDTDLVQVERTRENLEQRRERLQRLIEGVDNLLSDFGNRHTRPEASPEEAVPNVPDLVSLRNVTSPTNGLPDSPTRRQVIQHIIPSFHGEPFTASDIRQRFVQDYLEEEPPNFPQAINSLLKRMVKSGEIEEAGRDGEGATAPWLYREKDRGEMLNLGP